MNKIFDKLELFLESTSPDKYDLWLSKRNNINTIVDTISNKLNDLIKKNPNKNGVGLVSDTLRDNVKYKKLKKEYSIAFKQLQDFNKIKQYNSFSNRYRKEKRKQWRK